MLASGSHPLYNRAQWISLCAVGMRTAVMFDLYKLERKRRRIENSYEPEFEKARVAKDENAIGVLIERERLELNEVDEKVAIFYTRKLLTEAGKLDVEVPPFKLDVGYWQFGEHSMAAVLTPKGRSYLRMLIDKEKARRFEVKVRWVKLLLPLITALAGLIGVLTGLFAVLHQH